MKGIKISAEHLNGWLIIALDSGGAKRMGVGEGAVPILFPQGL